MATKIAVAILLLTGINAALSQDTAGQSLARGLYDCYNVTELLDRDLRPPATMSVVIDLIRKIENGVSRQDARQLSAELLHRFRQDGIMKLEDFPSPYTINYSPYGMQSGKNMLLLSEYIAGSQLNFNPNETLSAVEQCALHFMLSNTVELGKRENEECSRSGRYIQRRAKRQINPKKDVEVMSNVDPKPYGKIQNPKNDVDIPKPSSRAPKNMFQGPLSDCPVESGVVYDRHGAIQLGTVMAGIASGWAQQDVPVEESGENFRVDSTFAATIAGDLTEAALYLGPTNRFKVGAGGFWNSTYQPRYYFIDENKDYYMTDAEIRAGVDGLILAKAIQNNWKSRTPMLKVSQILDMYYSRRGLFSQSMRGCNRRITVNNLLNSQPGKLREQVEAFSVHYQQAQSRLTTSLEGVKSYSKGAVDVFLTYVASLNDLQCDTDNITRGAVELTIVLDTGFDYDIISNTISYLLDNIDLNMYGSNVTIINGVDGRVILNTTSSISEFYETYNRTTYQQHPGGFNYVSTYNKMEVMVKEKLEFDKQRGNVGGNSMVFLLMPTTTPSAEEKRFVMERLDRFRSYFSVFHIAIAGRASKEAYRDIVFDNDFDTFTISEYTDGIMAAVNPIAARIKQYPRRISNPKCGQNFRGDFSGNSVDLYIEPNTTNYHSISQQYLYGVNEKSVKIQGFSGGPLTVCAGSECKPINNNEASFSLTNRCEGKLIRDCSPFKFEVRYEAKDSNYFGCTERGCRFMDNIKYKVTVDGLECTSGSNALFSSLTLVSLIYVIFRMF